MAENSSNDTNNILYFIVGGLVVVVAGLAFMYFNGYIGDRGHKTQITIEVPKVQVQ